MTWSTTDDLGYVAFNYKKDALTAFPSRRAVRCSFALGHIGWLSLESGGTDNSNSIKTPDGREIPVVSGYTSEHGRLIGMRGGSPRTQYADDWRSIMTRVVESGLALHAYNQTR